MKTNTPEYSIKEFASTYHKMKAGHTIFWKQGIAMFAFVLFYFSASAQVDPVSVISSLGTPGPTTYGSLKLATDAINTGTHQGVISINIIGNTTETATAVLNASGSGTANYSSISIQPSGGLARSISGSFSSPVIDLNGADNVMIDGLNTGGNSLKVANTSATTNTCTIRYLSDATYNTIQNCTLSGSGASANSGTIFFSTALSSGNSNNTIANNNIGPAGTSLPSNAIYSEGTAANPNAGMTIINNNIYNYTTKGIEVSSTGSGAWSIYGNSFYKEANVFDTYNSIPAVHAIRIMGGSGYNISNNYIGGEGSQLAGNNAIYNTTGGLGFTGIQLATSSATPASYIKGNTISKIKISSLYTSGSFSFSGIATSGSGINLGGLTSGEGNTIGSSAVNGGISISTSTSTPVGPSSIYGIYCQSSGGLILGNQVAGIDIENVGSTPASSDFRGIYVSVPSPPSQVNNNTIGSITIANSIRVMATSTGTATNLTGIYLGSTISSALPQVNNNIIQNISHLSPVSSGTFNGINAQNGYVQSYQNNVIKNIYAAANSGAGSLVYTGIQSSTSLSPSTIISNNIIDNINYQSSGSAAQIRGMQISGSSPKVTSISGNSISNLSTFSQKTSLADTDNPSVFSVIGILFSTGGTSSVIANNNFYNFASLTTANTNTVIAALGIISPGGGNIYGNRMSGFTNSATGSTSLPGIIGIKAFTGTFNVYNNSIKFSNGLLSNSVNIYGIIQNTAGTTWNYFHNSVSISGNVSSGTAARTAAFIRTSEGGLLLKNNVFVNTRSGTGAHFSISNLVATPSATWLSSSSNYNNLYSSGANSIAEWGSGAGNTFLQFQTNSGGEANSISRSVSFIASVYDLQTDANSNCAMNNTGTPITTPVINTDLNSMARSAITPDMGAYEYAYIIPVHVASNDGPKCVGANATLGVATGTGANPFTFAWTGPDSFISSTQNPILPNLTAPMSGAYSVMVTDVNGCTSNIETTLTINALPAGTLSSDVGNTVITGSPVVFTATDGPAYNFKVNGTSMQNNASATYTTGILRTGDIVMVTVTNSNGCTASYPGITMMVSAVMVNGKKYIKWNGTKIKTWNGIKKVN